MVTAEPITTEFGFHVEYLDETDRVIRDQRLHSADFGHAIRHTWFNAVRLGLVDGYHPVAGGARIEPVFPNDHSSSPRAKGFVSPSPYATEGSMLASSTSAISALGPIGCAANCCGPRRWPASNSCTTG